MTKRKNTNFLNSAFISPGGRGKMKNIGKVLGAESLNSIKKGNSDSDNFAKADEFARTVKKVIGGGIGLGSNNHVVSLVEGTCNSLIGAARTENPLLTKSSAMSIGKNDATISYTYASTGVPTSSRVKRLTNNPYIDYEKKTVSSSKKDYQAHGKRKNLKIRGGFDRKSYVFLMEDTYLTIDDLCKFYLTDEKLKAELNRNKNGTRDVYGAFCKSVRHLHLMNKMELHNIAINLHLCQMTDIHDDVRHLILETTNNKYTNTIKKLKEELFKSVIDGAKGNLRGNAKGKDKAEGDSLDFNNDQLKNYLMRSNTRGGSIPEDEQYTDPVVDDKKNRIQIQFETNLKTKLTDSIHFQDRAKIVKTYRKVLTPSSSWDFTLETHFGKGIHLNYLNDIKELNKEYPVDYFIVLEIVGDGRAVLLRKKDKDPFLGYSPINLQFEFDTKICYMNDGKGEEEKPTYYRRKKGEDNFEEDGVFADIFCPDRDSPFNVSYDNIQLREDVNAKNKEYKLEYNANVLGSNEDSILQSVKNNFENNGLNPENVTEDDLSMNLKSVDNENDNDDEDPLNLD
jgi:hypothetical protein